MLYSTIISQETQNLFTFNAIMFSTKLLFKMFTTFVHETVVVALQKKGHLLINDRKLDNVRLIVPT